MSTRPAHAFTRRQFLEGATGLAAALTVVPFDLGAVEAAGGYQSLTSHAAVFTESMVNAMCPADRLTPAGVACGLARFIDSRLSDGSAADTFNAAALAADAACRRDRGVSFHRLDASAARQFLSDAAAGHIAASVPLAQWFDQQVNPLLIEACFSGPIYEGFNNRVFWKVFGHA